MDNSGSRLLVPYEDVKNMLGGIGKTTLHGLIGAGELQRVKIGRRAFITSQSLVAYVERLSQHETEQLGEAMGDAA
jgi:hypothetical protein